ncbi:hypothetical protein [sulfur-oxidizing endosymbiont of Gigantopelta aegis]|uniref:hypothetical protein n=1 Tax=sulfur-oxidizing endosymbiont of Gigantopelta aegis TaxID=2794934 RepID=UPI0018DB643C|nr:hypothetical protein [sulfur-oxidizing endosymbiont of Gigantopelta aegis]
MSSSKMSDSKQNIKESLFSTNFQTNLSQEQKAWRPLHLLNLYRLLISGIFVALIFSNTEIRPFGLIHPELFKIVSFGYLIASILNGFYYSLALAGIMVSNSCAYITGFWRHYSDYACQWRCH